MKKSLIVLAALTGFAGVASAQSSVTLFGIVDLAARNVKNGGGTVSSLSPSGSATSRLGLRGVEDLGGGMRAGFWLEGDLQADVGQSAGQSWQRRSTVSLSGGFGELRLGRDYTPDFWNHTVFDPFATAGVGNSLNTFTAINNGTDLVRANNSIGYFLPNMGGLYGQVMVALGEGRGSVATPARKHTGFRLGYAAGPVNVAFAMGNNEIGVAGQPVAEYDRWNVGASYAFGKSSMMFQYNNGKAKGAGTAQGGQSVKHYLIGGRFAVGNGIVKASYIRSDGSGPTAALNARDATQIALGYEQPLSRRTALYTNFARITNKAGAAYSMAGGNANTAGSNTTGYEFGVRHAF
jgi:predicted porin